MKHIIRVSALVALITVILWTWLGSSSGFDALVPLRASEEAAFVDRLFAMHLYVIAFLFALIMGFMFYSFFVFRRKPGEKGDGDHFEGNTTLEIVWTIIPLGTVLYFSALGAQYLHEITAPEPNELVVEVISQQWNWRFDYPEYEISSAELVLPEDRQILLELQSLDVIHSFWVPEFRIKQDAVPGMIKPLRITPTEPGEYTIRCAEMCGKDHAIMLAAVTVKTQNDFQEWVHELTEPPEVELTEAELGQQLVEINGCFKCHTIDGSPNDGPTWLGVYGSEEQLTDGTTVTVDEDYLRESILDPQAKTVVGFEGVDMPATFGKVLSDEDIDHIIDFIESLSDN